MSGLVEFNRIGQPEHVNLRDHGEMDLADGRYTFASHSDTVLAFDIEGG